MYFCPKHYSECLCLSVNVRVTLAHFVSVQVFICASLLLPRLLGFPVNVPWELLWMKVEVLFFFPSQMQAHAYKCLPVPTHTLTMIAVGPFSAELERTVLTLNGRGCAVNSTAVTRKCVTSLVQQPELFWLEFLLFPLPFSPLEVSFPNCGALLL